MSDSHHDSASDSESARNTESLDLTATPCGICGPSTCDEEMIGCDGCEQWFHSRCVGLTGEKKPAKWFCKDDGCQQKAARYKQAKKNKPGKKDSATPANPPSLTLAERLKALEEKEKKQQEEMEVELRLQQKERRIQRALEMKRIELEMQLRAEEEEEERALQEDILRKKKEQIERIKASRGSFAEQLANLDKELKQISVSVPGKTESKVDSAIVDDAVPKDPRENTSGEESDAASEDEDSDAGSDQGDSGKKTPGKPKKVLTKLPKKVNSVNASKKEEKKAQVGPTKAQLSARKGLTYKLSKFSGVPADWPLFYSSFKISNEACGYMNYENLIRLHECLEGNARELVIGQLIFPEMVPKVIERLRRHFGRPQQILESILEKVNKLPAPNDLESFVPFANTVAQLCEHLEAAELHEHLTNPLLIKSLVEKIPYPEKRDWVHYKRAYGGDKPALRTLTDWLMEFDEDACDADITIDFKPKPQLKQQPKPQAKNTQSGRRVHEKGALYSHSEVKSSSKSSGERKQKPCKMCKSTEHRLRSCEKFKKLTYDDRMKLVTREKLCVVCLNDHGGQCWFRFHCDVGDCREKHNSLLHPVASAVGLSAHIRSNSTILFRIVPVQLHCGDKTITLLAFLDEGASVTLLEKNLADRLGVTGVQERLTIQWTADHTREEKESRRMNMWVSGVGAAAGEKMLLHSVRTVGKLMLPRQTLNFQELAAQYSYMRDLPVESYDGQPELLIGLNNIHSFAPMEAKARASVEPVAVRCKLGWTVYGPRLSPTMATGDFLGYHHAVTNEDLHELLKSHYALEESVMVVPQESADEKRARQILERTTMRVGDRFETGLLWATDDPRFPDSKPMALRRLKQLEKKLDKDPEIRAKVCKQIEEYQAKGYAHLATEEELETASDRVWYLPIGVVENPNKPGKVRLVWDAAASVGDVSLNSLLLKGPDLLVSLVKVIMGFRERRIAFGGDLKEMFHQLKIRAEDKQAQRFLFRTNPDDPPSVYVMDVATFGSTCSPCSAQYVKNKNAEEYAVQYPKASAAIIQRHYVDDYFDSVDTEEEAIQLAKDVRTVHQKGGFEIRNWVSNSPEVLRSLGEEKPAAPVHFNMDKESCKERVLGVIWDPDTDEFTFSTKQREGLSAYLYGGERPTKRNVASCVMGFFDPLGLLSPFTIHGKIAIQHLWRSKCGWDELIDDTTWELWKKWTGLLPEVEAIRIPRCYLGNHQSSEVESLQLHIFTDASENAYGCVAYLRAAIRGEVRCTLIMSRAKVAPLKRQSIPRLELMAALLGARISRTIRDSQSLKIDRTVLWTDSRTVWSWIHSDQHKFKQFVAFRVGEIWELTNVADWRWIPTKLNIADVVTKWGQGPPLRSDSEWFNGPAFLHQPEDRWPSAETTVDETEEDVRGIVLFHGTINAEPISRWSKLLRVTASVLRFIENCRRKKRGEPTVTSLAMGKHRRIIEETKARHATRQAALEQAELQQAENALWRQVQWDSFPDEMSMLSRNLERQPGQPPETIRKSSAIYKISPVLDENGVLRMDSRLANAVDSSFDKRYPIILSRTHDITRKLIQHYHEIFGHANSETVFNEMRQRFQIPKLRSSIQQETKACVWCKVHKCQPYTPKMAPLPVDRVTVQLRAFSSVGIDYLGPLEVSIGRRREKRWVAVFTCLTIRAVHLEVVHSLTTESCRMAISRFCSRYGKPRNIFSDNATCFRGANNEMVKMQAINQQCAENVVSPTTAWHFNPPGTPHMGGIWERMVRSVKVAMRALDDGRKLTDEILATTLAEAADMINTRPLTYLPQDSEEAEALTPNHFLRGSVTSADGQLDEGPTDAAQALRSTYKRSQFLADRMWERWLKEYLPTINHRPKWLDEQKSLKKGDLVFVVDGKNRKSWKRGVIEAVIKGSDKAVRQADVRMADRSVQRRGVVNLAELEIQ